MERVAQYGFFWRVCIWVAMGAVSTHAAQVGPRFPTHRFPTDRSFHLGYELSYLSTSSNFVGPLSTDGLLDGGAFRIFRHTLTPEFQPNRRLSLGLFLQFDQAKLSFTNDEASESGFSDQTMFAEYRFYDAPGASLGFATLVKFPFYKNPAVEDLGDGSVVLLGDQQIDFTLMGTGAFWLNEVLRTRFDMGLTIRTDGYSPEVPYMASVAFVTPKMDLELAVKGNLSFSKDAPEGIEGLKEIREAFANSDYALAQSPWLFIVNPSVELWLSSKWSLSVDYNISLMGNEAPAFQSFGVGAIYRWAETRRRQKRTFRDVDIRTDQEAGVFEGDQSSDPESLVEPVPEDRIEEEAEPMNEILE